MKKVGAIYWSNSTRASKKKSRGKKKPGAKKQTPQWFVFTVVVLFTFILCTAINFRAFTEVRKQVSEYSELNTEIETLTTTNIVLQEEIQNLKKDDQTIAREARKIGMSRSNEKVLVPKN